ncbi:tailspike protein [Bacillus phage vB_BceM-HSE3]|nr:tailspike protein [Bacillus phage vB_BceM-HSE3]
MPSDKLILNSMTTNVLDVRGLGAIGDGVADDTSAIQSAFDLIHTQNGINTITSMTTTVVIPRGVYKITSPLRIPSNTYLKMDPGAVLLRSANINTLLVNRSDGNIGGYDASSNITIEGGILDGNKSKLPSSGNLISLGHCEFINIKNVTLRNLHDWNMIQLAGVQHAKIKGCTFKDQGYAQSGSGMIQFGVLSDSLSFPFFGPYDSTSCKNITIEDNIMLNGIRAIESRWIINKPSHIYINISRNYIEYMSKEALWIYGTRDFTVADNFIGSCYIAVYLTNEGTVEGITGRCLITRNTVIGTANSYRGIHVSNFCWHGVISHNRVEGGSAHGIGIDQGLNWLVDSNNVYNCGQTGVWIWGTLDTTVSNNYLRWNNSSNTFDRWDLMIGSGPRTTTSINVTGNRVGTTKVQKANKVNFAGNRMFNGLAYGGEVQDINLDYENNW